MGRTWGCALGSQSCPTRHCKLQDLTRRALVSHRPGGRSPRWRRPTAGSLPRAVGGSPVRASVAGPRPWRPGPHVRHPHVRSQHRVVSSPRLLSGCRPGPRCDRWGGATRQPPTAGARSQDGVQGSVLLLGAGCPRSVSRPRGVPWVHTSVKPHEAARPGRTLLLCRGHLRDPGRSLAHVFGGTRMAGRLRALT